MAYKIICMFNIIWSIYMHCAQKFHMIPPFFLLCHEQQNRQRPIHENDHFQLSLFSSTLPSVCLLPLLKCVLDSLFILFIFLCILCQGRVGFCSPMVQINEISMNHCRVFLHSTAKHFCSTVQKVWFQSKQK